MDPAGMAELKQHGIELVQSNENYLRILHGMGVPSERTVLITEFAADTFEELRRVRQLSAERRWSSILIVTSNYHTRRTRLIAQYVLEPEVRTEVIPSRYGGIDRENWWRNTGELRTFLIEFQKLVAYTLYIWPGSLWTNPDDTKPSNMSSAFPGSFWMLSFSLTSSSPVGVSEFVTSRQA
jgi:hypothetical protein